MNCQKCGMKPNKDLPNHIKLTVQFTPYVLCAWCGLDLHKIITEFVNTPVAVRTLSS